MNSQRVRSVAADSNVLLSAIAGRAARRVFEHPDVEVVTTEHNIAEVMEYVPEFAARYELPESLVLEIIALLPVRVLLACRVGNRARSGEAARRPPR